MVSYSNPGPKEEALLHAREIEPKSRVHSIVHLTHVLTSIYFRRSFSSMSPRLYMGQSTSQRSSVVAPTWGLSARHVTSEKVHSPVRTPPCTCCKISHSLVIPKLIPAMRLFEMFRRLMKIFWGLWTDHSLPCKIGFMAN